jgi:ubiquinone/menaquinone biosynthesis C-methylase UbiE
MKDLFSRQADVYAKYRPTYPKALIDYVLSFVNEKNFAWDCATGNGQAALMLAPYFKKIAATDLSQKQVDHAIPNERISYYTGSAEKTFFADNCFDLITVAQAYHWFSFDAFFQEATRVARPEGIVAVWGYGLITTEDLALHETIQNFYTQVVGPYWDAERKYVDDAYRSIPFYFQELPSKDFSIYVTWNKEDLTGFLNTWSSVQHFIKGKGYNPVNDFEKAVSRIWGEEKKKAFSFPLFLRIGRIKK